MCTIHVVFKELRAPFLSRLNRKHNSYVSFLSHSMTQFRWPESNIWSICFSPPNRTSTLIFPLRLSYHSQLCCDAGVNAVFHLIYDTVLFARKEDLQLILHRSPNSHQIAMTRYRPHHGGFEPMNYR